MRTRFTPLVKVKKNDMDRCEQDLRQANESIQNAEHALQVAYTELETTDMPASGPISELLKARNRLTAQRAVIQERREWLSFARAQAEAAREQLKASVMEYEKFKYLEAEQVKKVLQERKRTLANQLDEIAIQSHGYKQRSER